MPRDKARASGKKRKGRGPVDGAVVTVQKRPFIGEPDGDDPTLIWGVGLVDLDGPWGWQQLDAAQVGFILEKCRRWEGMQQSEVFGPGGNKFIPVENLCAKARRRLEEIERDDLDGLWELRLGGKQRIWGWRIAHVFYPIWWDPEHTVCPSNKN